MTVGEERKHWGYDQITDEYVDKDISKKEYIKSVCAILFVGILCISSIVTSVIALIGCI